MGQWKRRAPIDRRRGRQSGWIAPCVVLIALLMASLGGATAGAAETPATTKSPFGVTGGTAGGAPFGAPNGSVAQPGSEPSALSRFADRAWSLLLFEQHRLTQNMTGAVRDIKSSTSIATATSALVVASFVYGILHAVGPGHGKAVISSYMLADKETLRRGIFLAFLSSFIQALSAITLIGGLWLAARATGLETKLAEAWLETLSWGCVAVVGAWLMLKQVWPLVAGIFAKRAAAEGHDHSHAHAAHDHDHHGHDHAHDHGHTHEHSHAHGPGCSCGDDHASAAVAHVHDERGHDEHVHDEHCGHAHLPGPEELAGDLSWSKALAIAFSIGIRPCTGALLVIVFAAAQGSLWAGILATFAMALGTALTVSALAAASVGSRNLAIFLAGSESPWGNVVARGASFLSSATVFVLGTAFFFASLHSTRPF
jgi:ABC-type nickel/cobalt efflux system permease component RcnA